EMAQDTEGLETPSNAAENMASWSDDPAEILHVRTSIRAGIQWPLTWRGFTEVPAAAGPPPAGS
ncbi:MAG: hypothetical protein V3S24_08575, partial [Candidatus Tectomicrobia bacterium]